MENQDSVKFTVDASLINRLGIELVGRVETAVSELIKNSYDADATNVTVDFINTNEVKGTIKIEDDGSGMTLNQLQDGFMRIASADKLQHPVSNICQRKKAGKKGIGRFATQRLGEKLTIITQTRSGEKAIKITINWNNFQINTDITSIAHPVDKIDKLKSQGTILIIEKVRDIWTQAQIKRVFRYVLDLLQPSFLSDEGKALRGKDCEDCSFSVKFYESIGRERTVIASPQGMIHSNAMALIKGRVDENGVPFFSAESKKFGLEDIDEILNDEKYPLIKNVHFQAYYFIYNRTDYYKNISKLELKSIKKLAGESSGIRLYRNGFRVLPYGEASDDWLGIDAEGWSRIEERKNGDNVEKIALANIPFSNRNLFGFVELIDGDEGIQDETASREGMIQTPAFRELTNFVSIAIKQGLQRVAEKIKVYLDRIRKEQRESQLSIPYRYITQSLDTGKTLLHEIIESLQKLENIPPDVVQKIESILGTFITIERDIKAQIEEVNMLRVLAGLGLVIGEFTHEIRQFGPIFQGNLNFLEQHVKEEKTKQVIKELKQAFKKFSSYTAYFDKAVSRNVSRELQPIDLREVVSEFKETIQAELDNIGIEFMTDFYGYDLYTIPMHPSEWSSILFNLYTNSKKAIIRAKSKGKIAIIAGREDNKLYLEFTDNGDGIKKEHEDRVFNAFFTTSTPIGLNKDESNALTGTGLGLTIVKDILETYDATISIIPPETNYETCFRIEIPEAAQEQIDKHVS